MDHSIVSLFPFQREAAKWLASKRAALLAYDMGLGKTAIAVTASDLVESESVVVVCPAVAVENWIREFSRFSQRTRRLEVVSYASLHKLSPEPFDTAILDESHYLKSTEAQRTKAVYGKTGLLRRVKRAWALSGTPAPNHAGELWPMLYAFGATQLAYDDFIERFCILKRFKIGGQVRQNIVAGTNTERIPELKSILKPLMLRKRKEEVMNLPPITYEDVVVPASEVDLEVESSFIQYVFPEDRRKQLFRKLEDERKLLAKIIEKTGPTSIDMVKSIEAIANSISTLRRYIGLQKTSAVADLIEGELMVDAYEKIVIFAIHRDVIEKLRERLSKYGVVTLYGGTEPGRRQRNVDKFQTSPKCRVFIGNIQAAGCAITLTAAHNVIFVEQDWVPGNNAQAAMRCHRIGQTKPVYVRFVGLANSLDENIALVLKRKAREITALIDDMTH